MANADPVADDAALLPFYVNGTLDAANRQRIEAALPASPALRAELARLEALHKMIRRQGEMLVDGEDKSEERLEAILGILPDKAAPPAPAPEAPPKRPLWHLLSALNPKRWHPAISLALAIAVAAQAAWIVSSDDRPLENGYRTVGGQDDNNPDAKGRIIIRVQDEASWSDVAELLDTEGLTIISGPAEGRLTLAGKAQGADLDALVTRLKASPLIAFAGKGA